MGQTQSLSGERKATAPQKKQQHALKIPESWKNDCDFRVVSPVSDISNPSQFRGRHVNYGNINSSTAAAAAVNTVRRNRTSKVCAKQRPPTGLPPPTRFYFESTDDDADFDEAIIEETEHGKHHASAPPPPTTKRTLIATWKAKYAKAKQQLGDCFLQAAAAVVVVKNEDPTKHRNYSQRVPSKDETDITKNKQKSMGHQEPEPYLQLDEFKPVWKETGKHLLDVGTAKKQPRRGGRVHLQDRSQPREEALEIDREAHTPIQAAKLFGQDDKAMTGTCPIEGPPSVLPSVRRSGSTEACIQVIGKALSLNSASLQSKKAKTLHSSSVASSSQPISCRTNSTANGRTANNGNDKLAVFRTKPSDNADGRMHGNGYLCKSSSRQRASIGRSYSSSSADERRTSVQESVQRQIDSVQHNPVSRVERLRHQYQQELGKISLKKTAPRSIAVDKANDRFSLPKDSSMFISVAEQSKAIEGRQTRAASVPGRKSALAVHHPIGDKHGQLQSKEKGLEASKRSISVPRPSVEGSALLHLTGWKSSGHVKEPELPALLHIAGWDKDKKRCKNPPKQRPSETLQKRLSTVSEPPRPKRSSTTEHKIARHSEPTTNALPAQSSTENKVVGFSERTKPKQKRAMDRKPAPARREPLHPHNENQPKGRASIASMLQQAYFNDDEMVLKSQDAKDPSVASTGDVKEKSSPTLSVDSGITGLSAATVSEQALNNADFLFSDDEKAFVPTTTKGDGILISTLDSRSRMTTVAKAVRIPLSSSASLASKESSTRRVRFSEDIPNGNAIGVHIIPELETKLSDLTEFSSCTFDNRESAESNLTAMSIPRIDSIPEEDEDESLSPTDDSVSQAFEQGEVALQEEGQQNIQDEIPSVMSWSYTAEGGHAKGVTPIVSNKTSGRATNSPYLRFQDAKDKFSVTNHETAKKASAVKRTSPVKRATNSIVTARVAAMEGRLVRSEGGIAKVVIPKRARRATTGRDALAPRKGSLVSPMFLEGRQASRLQHKHETMPSNLNGGPSQMGGSPKRNLQKSGRSFDEVDSASQDYEDEFEAILHPTTIDEGSGDDFSRSHRHTHLVTHNSPNDSNGADFEDLLNYSDSQSDSPCAGSDVSTVVRDVPRPSVASTLTATTDTPSVATVLDARRLLASSDSISVVSNTSSNNDTASVSKVLQAPNPIDYEDENEVPSLVGRMHGELPFREEAPVKPNEQNHRPSPGFSRRPCMERTPLQARKWRALAAAAQEKDRKLGGRRSSLSERTNTRSKGV